MKFSFFFTNLFWLRKQNKTKKCLRIRRKKFSNMFIIFTSKIFEICLRKEIRSWKMKKYPLMNSSLFNLWSSLTSSCLIISLARWCGSCWPCRSVTFARSYWFKIEFSSFSLSKTKKKRFTIAEIKWASSFWSSNPSLDTSHLNNQSIRSNHFKRKTNKSKIISSRSSKLPVWFPTAERKRNSLKSMVLSWLVSIISNKVLQISTIQINFENETNELARQRCILIWIKFFIHGNKCFSIDFTRWKFTKKFLFRLLFQISIC